LSAIPEGPFDSPRAPEPVGAYPHARRVGNLLFISGMGPRKRGSTAIPGVERTADGLVVDYDISIETRSVFENLQAILEDAGSGLEQVVDVTCFLTDLKADFDAFNRVYREYLGAVRPTRTTVEVRRLPTPIHVELKVIATIG